VLHVETPLDNLWTLALIPGSNLFTEGAPNNVVRIVTENSQALKFGSHGFEEE